MDRFSAEYYKNEYIPYFISKLNSIAKWIALNIHDQIPFILVASLLTCLTVCFYLWFLYRLYKEKAYFKTVFILTIPVFLYVFIGYYILIIEQQQLWNAPSDCLAYPNVKYDPMLFKM